MSTLLPSQDCPQSSTERPQTGYAPGLGWQEAGSRPQDMERLPKPFHQVGRVRERAFASAIMLAPCELLQSCSFFYICLQNDFSVLDSVQQEDEERGWRMAHFVILKSEFKSQYSGHNKPSIPHTPATPALSCEGTGHLLRLADFNLGKKVKLKV